LEAAKTGWLKARQVSRATDSTLAGLLSSHLYLGRDLQFDAQRDELVRNLTREQVNAAMQKHLDYSRMISVKAGDFKNAK
jgi:zinc protease